MHWPTCQNSSLYVFPVTFESETYTHTDRVKTITPVALLMQGVKICSGGYILLI